LKAINFKDEDTMKCLNYINNTIDKSVINNLAGADNINYINKVCTTLNPDNVKQIIESKHNSDIREIVKLKEPIVHSLSNGVVNNHKHLENEYQSIIKEITSKEANINEIIEYYGDYLKHNKNFLIRNEILKHFLDGVVITKEEKDNLLNKTLYDEKFFKLIFKMNDISHNIKVIDRNNEKFSKNLIFSIKENFNIMDDLLNEKIVLFLKNLFRSSLDVMDYEQFKNMKNTLFYLREKDNYLNFILKEYTQMRRKLLEETLKKKYYKITKNEDIFQILIEDVEKHFLKEFILLFILFNNDDDLSAEEEHICLELFNNNINEGKFERLLPRLVGNKKMKDFNFYVTYLNTILYSLDELFYENVNRRESLQKQESISEVYAVTILSYYYESRLEKLLKSNNFIFNDNLNIFAMINNTKKTFSKSLSKLINDTHKNLLKLQKNTISYLKEDNILTASNENNLTKVLNGLTEEYGKIISHYEKYTNELSLEEKESLSPASQNAFTLLIDFFNTEAIKNETNTNILLKLLNLINIVTSKLNVFKVDLTSLTECFDRSEAIIINSIVSSILKATKFEENLKNNISHEQTINLIEHILEKSRS
jgi:hypothetical protein